MILINGKPLKVGFRAEERVKAWEFYTSLAIPLGRYFTIDGCNYWHLMNYFLFLSSQWFVVRIPHWGTTCTTIFDVASGVIMPTWHDCADVATVEPFVEWLDIIAFIGYKSARDESRARLMNLVHVTHVPPWLDTHPRD